MSTHVFARGRRVFGGRAFAVLLLLGSARPGQGQSPAAPQPGTKPVDAGAGAGAGPGGMAPRRQILEQRVRQRFEEIVQQRLQLTDDQVRRLRETNVRFAAERRLLADREREMRGEIRRELQPGVAANQDHVAALTDSLFAIQRQRLDAAQAEQKELAGYLSPVQRVRYYGLQEQLRRRLELIRQRRRTGMLHDSSVAP
jgi:hypothetical protein